MSRAACSASVASAACSEPTCLCASPLRLRIKTSHKGMACVVMATSSGCGFSALALLRIGQRGLAHPGAFVMRLAARRETVAIARPIAGQHLIEFFPVDGAVLPMSFRVLPHAGIRNRQAEEMRLRHRGVDEFLAQLVIGKTLDLPSGGSIAVLARP